MFILTHGTWKDNITFVILDWRWITTGNSRRPVSSPCVFLAVALHHKKAPCHKRKICANSLWQYSYYTQSSPSKNKNMNHSVIYLRVFRCLFSGAICNRNRNFGIILHVSSFMLSRFFFIIHFVCVCVCDLNYLDPQTDWIFKNLHFIILYPNKKMDASSEKKEQTLQTVFFFPNTVISFF